MACKEIVRKGGTTVNHSNFVGQEGEFTIDTDKNTMVVHDGITAGGFPLALEDHTHADVDFRVGDIICTMIPNLDPIIWLPCNGQKFDTVVYRDFLETQLDIPWQSVKMGGGEVTKIDVRWDSIWCVSYSNGMAVRSTNGVDWQRINLNVGSFSMHDAEFFDNVWWFLGDSSIIVYSADYGVTWTRITYDTLGIRNIRDLTPVYSISKYVMVDSNGSVLFADLSNFNTWSRNYNFPTCNFCHYITSGRWIVGQEDQGIVYSDDFGLTWNQTNVIDKTFTSIIEISDILITASSEGAWTSNDRGGTWTRITEIPSNKIVSVAKNSFMWMICDELDVYVSLDGVNWSRKIPNISVGAKITTSRMSETQMIVGTDDGHFSYLRFGFSPLLDEFNLPWYMRV